MSIPQKDIELDDSSLLPEAVMSENRDASAEETELPYSQVTLVEHPIVRLAAKVCVDLGSHLRNTGAIQ
jgi:hypothetical protein